MKNLEQLRQHLLTLQKRGSTVVTFDIATLLGLLPVKSNKSTASVDVKQKSLWVDGGDFTDDDR